MAEQEHLLGKYYPVFKEDGYPCGIHTPTGDRAMICFSSLDDVEKARKEMGLPSDVEIQQIQAEDLVHIVRWLSVGNRKIFLNPHYNENGDLAYTELVPHLASMLKYETDKSQLN